jgi:hypothetical protein
MLITLLIAPNGKDYCVCSYLIEECSGICLGTLLFFPGSVMGEFQHVRSCLPSLVAQQVPSGGLKVASQQRGATLTLHPKHDGTVIVTKRPCAGQQGRVGMEELNPASQPPFNGQLPGWLRRPATVVIRFHPAKQRAIFPWRHIGLFVRLREFRLFVRKNI